MNYLLNVKKHALQLMLILVALPILFALTTKQQSADERIISYVVDLTKQDLNLYWKNEKGEQLRNFQNLKAFVENKKQKLLFAMNGGMYKADQSPQGLYVQQGELLSPLDTSSDQGNFYLKPNGVFFITDYNQPAIYSTTDFGMTEHIRYATQSGPMLVINGNIHPAFKEGSKNLNIRNGVGILPDKRIVFAMSKKEINFYDFAMYFKKLGCKNALYLDGFVSRVYLPEQNWVQTDGNFGVMIGVTAPSK